MGQQGHTDQEAKQTEQADDPHAQPSQEGIIQEHPSIHVWFPSTKEPRAGHENRSGK